MLSESTLDNPRWVIGSFSEQRAYFLVILVLISALGVIYISDFNRRLMINYTNLQNRTEELQTDKNRLLLECGHWGAQFRIQAIAQNKLQMRLPDPAEIITIKV